MIEFPGKEEKRCMRCNRNRVTLSKGPSGVYFCTPNHKERCLDLWAARFIKHEDFKKKFKYGRTK